MNAEYLDKYVKRQTWTTSHKLWQGKNFEEQYQLVFFLIGFIALSCISKEKTVIHLKQPEKLNANTAQKMET